MVDIQSLIQYLTGNFKYSSELQAFFMALQGSVAVRSTTNKNNTLTWFHAFVLSVFAAYSGASFGSLWMARPTSMLSNDLNFFTCILAFTLVNYTPFDIGYKISKLFPVVILTTLLAQLFRVCGLKSYSDIAFETFKGSPSKLGYPIPIFGPILNATLLGNMGGIFSKGLNNYLKDGIPWPFQSGLVCATFYHFYVHDTIGIIGVTLRQYVKILLTYAKGIDMLQPLLELDDETFAFVVISLFQHVVAVLQLPYFIGPKFSPLNADYLYHSVREITFRSSDIGDKTEQTSDLEISSLSMSKLPLKTTGKDNNEPSLRLNDYKNVDHKTLSKEIQVDKKKKKKTKKKQS